MYNNGGGGVMIENGYKKVEDSAKKVWVIDGIIASIILMIIAYLMYHFAEKYVSYWPFLLAVVVSFLSIFVHPFIEYEQWGYCITDEKVEFQHGIYYKKKTIIPISRIQHLNIKQGPIQKIFGLATIEIYTAGNSHSIEAILMSEAEYIVEGLNREVLKVIKDEDK